jgi:hypothetical protein
MIDYSLILVTYYIGKLWSLNGDLYEGLDWFDETPKPTKEELDALWPSTIETVSKQNCKQQAQEILYKTDWTTIPDVADPTYTPYLINQTEFKQYRAVIRGYAVNPVVDPVWPTPPTEQWSS